MPALLARPAIWLEVHHHLRSSQVDLVATQLIGTRCLIVGFQCFDPLSLLLQKKFVAFCDVQESVIGNGVCHFAIAEYPTKMVAWCYMVGTHVHEHLPAQCYRLSC